MSLPYLSRHDIEGFRPKLQKIIYKITGNTETELLSTVENCLYNGYDRRKSFDKLTPFVADSKKKHRIIEKLERLVDDHKASMKSRKRSHDDEHKDKEREKKSKSKHEPLSHDREENGSIEKKVTQAIVRPEPESIVPPPTTIDVMLVNAQRDIAERKKLILETIKRKAPNAQPLSPKPKPDIPNPMADTERARKIAALQEQIKLKIGGAYAAVLAQPVQEKPKPLILDSEGRTVDISGREIMVPTLTPTLKANIRAKRKEGYRSQNSDKNADDTNEPKFFDDRITIKTALRNKRSLKFHEPGKFQQIGDRMRMKAQLDKLQNEISQIARKTGISSATKLALIAPKADTYCDEVPQYEWWDSVILTDDLNTYKDGQISIRDAAISNLIEHPTQIRSPQEQRSQSAYMPVFLTKKERKKLRRQNRREAWKEEQEKIRLGLEAPPEPKLRISNLMRVLGTEAVQDPTKIESHVREQMVKRQKAHEEANRARKLTVEQKREKKMRKIREDTSMGIYVSVYRIKDLHNNASKKFKVETNAKQLLMTGVVVLFRDCCVVVVEGGAKQQKKYRRLMTQRIRWEEDLVINPDGNEVTNACNLVWEGLSQRRHFGEIKFKVFPMEKMAREFFQRHHVEHYWDLAYSGAVLEASEDV